MKTGIYYAYWTHDWDTDFILYLEKAKKLGFDILEVNAGTIARMDVKERDRLKKAAIDQDIEMSCCIGLPPSSDLASSKKDVRKAGIAHLDSIGHAMADCGIKKLSGIIYSCWPGNFEGREGTLSQAWEWSVASMKEAIITAQELGLIYNVEVVNRFEQFLFNTAAEGLEYVKEVNSPNLKILLDTFHMNIEEDCIADAIRKTGDYLGHLHVGENNRKPPGYGHIPWESVAEALSEINYDQWVVMEPFILRGGEVGRDIKVFRDQMPDADLDEEARKACAFIKKVFI